MNAIQGWNFLPKDRICNNIIMFVFWAFPLHMNSLVNWHGHNALFPVFDHHSKQKKNKSNTLECYISVSVSAWCHVGIFCVVIAHQKGNRRRKFAQLAVKMPKKLWTPATKTFRNFE